ncbi:MAG: hypothetical protein JRN18_01420 [Nitrososphaerota archaeon]|nr:hypothetical protein [Nitrososphaerota archaeon]
MQPESDLRARDVDGLAEPIRTAESIAQGEEKLVDRVYKTGIRQLRKDLARLKNEFVLDSGDGLDDLRIDPLLKHAEALAPSDLEVSDHGQADGPD